MENKLIGHRLIEHFKKLVFDEPSHTYKVVGKGLKPVSTFIGEFAPKFHANLIAPRSAAKEGVTTKEILDRWDRIRDEACEMGTRVHDFAERYVIDRYGIPTTLKFKSVYQHVESKYDLTSKERAVIKFWDAMPSHYAPVTMELRMFCVEIGLAGTADIILLDKRDNTLVIADYKTNKDLFKQYKDQKLLGIFSDMRCTPFSKYKIQLSTYQVLLEKTGYKVSRRFLVWLREDGEYEIFNTSDITPTINKHFEDKLKYADW